MNKFILGVVIGLSLISCQATFETNVAEAETPQRFKLIDKYNGDHVKLRVYVDKETGVEYVAYWTSSNGSAGGFIPLYEADGSLKTNDKYNEVVKNDG